MRVNDLSYRHCSKYSSSNTVFNFNNSILLNIALDHIGKVGLLNDHLDYWGQILPS